MFKRDFNGGYTRGKDVTLDGNNQYSNRFELISIRRLSIEKRFELMHGRKARNIRLPQSVFKRDLN